MTYVLKLVEHQSVVFTGARFLRLDAAIRAAEYKADWLKTNSHLD